MQSAKCGMPNEVEKKPEGNMIKRMITILILTVMTAAYSRAAALKIGDKAPDFKLTDQNGKIITLSQFAGKKDVVLYFYPKDFTKGCTTEACSFRDNYQAFMDRGAEVIGVSADSAESHMKFTSEYKLPFSLLSDPNGALAKSYGVDIVLGSLLDRMTFIIDKSGEIRFVYKSLKNALSHVDRAMNELKALEQKK
jgi:peroxiredoxin Q/BCP